MNLMFSMIINASDFLILTSLKLMLLGTFVFPQIQGLFTFRVQKRRLMSKHVFQLNDFCRNQMIFFE